MEEEVKQRKIKNLRQLYEYRQKLYQKPILKDLFLEVTSRCNARCEHCGSRCGDAISTEEISVEDWKRTLYDISTHYRPQDIWLNVTGGEPLMRKDLFEIMDYASQLGYHWGMTTNGMLITDEVLEKMNSTHMETVSVSLDGLKETHERFRKVPGCYERIIENIKKLQTVPSIKIVQVTTVVNKRNLHELESLYQLMKELHILSWRVIPVDPIGRAKENSEILLDPEDYRFLFSFLREKREENVIHVEYGCSHYLGIPLEKELRDTYFYCVTGLYVASILSNGDIFVCPNVERRPELIQGNIKKDSFVDVWEHRFQMFRTDERTSCSSCRKCKDWEYCLGDSFHTFDFDSKKPRFCIKNIYEEERR